MDKLCTNKIKLISIFAHLRQLSYTIPGLTSHAKSGQDGPRENVFRDELFLSNRNLSKQESLQIKIIHQIL